VYVGVVSPDCPGTLNPPEPLCQVVEKPILPDLRCDALATAAIIRGQVHKTEEAIS